MQGSYTCPFCQRVIAITGATHYEETISYRKPSNGMGFKYDEKYGLKARFFNCPNCQHISSLVDYNGTELPQKSIPIFPVSLAKQFPNYIPKTIINDYEEACAIVSLSPKASATLSRRCLQGMIRDYWNISEATLYKEIDALKDKIPADLWTSIDSLRQIGNIGAHMEKDTNVIVDIDNNEATTLIKLIELLIKEWYINREERKELFTTIQIINQSKQSDRKKSE